MISATGSPMLVDMRSIAALRRISERYPGWVDTGIAFLLATFILVTLWVQWPGEATVAPWTAVALTLWLIAPLAWRRRYPLATLLIMTPALIVFQRLRLPEYAWAVNAWWLALFGAGAYGSASRRNWVRALASLIWIAFLVDEIFFRVDYGGAVFDRRLLQLLAIVTNLVFLGVVWWFGDTVRIRRERETELAAQTIELEREREEKATQAVLAERLRIARELHDVVANHVSVVGVQAGAARRTLDRDPERAIAALSSIEETSRLAVQELQQLLGLLRESPHAPARSAQPGLAQLDELVAHMRDTGIPVDLQISGDPRPLPPGTELSIYRIVQEALTNSLKHAHGASATVALRYCLDGIDLTIDDNGAHPPPADYRAQGNGLIGMQERVALLGGHMEAGYLPDVGFSVRVRLPLSKMNGSQI